MAKKLTQTPVYEGVIVDVSKVRYELPDQTIFDAEVVNHPGGVCIAATNDNNHSFFMVKQFRFGTNETLLEFPAGLIDPNEPPLQSALRELEEETGYRANTIKPLGSLFLSPGGSDEIIHLFYATDLTFVGQRLDQTEDLTVESIPFTTLYKQALSGELKDAKSVALVFHLQAIIEGNHQQ